MIENNQPERDPTKLYSNKAQAYAKHRPDYSPRAFAAFKEASRIPTQSVVLDVGSGTGMLTRHLLRHFDTVYGIEPTKEMREISEDAFRNQPRFHSLDGRAEAIPLPNQYVDLIAVGQAIHWFQPKPALVEFQWVAKHQAWLLLAHIQSLDEELNQAISTIFTEGNGILSRSEHPPSNLVPNGYYFQSGKFKTERFVHSRPEPWETFVGGIVTAAYAPDQGHPLYGKFTSAARKVFQLFSQDGILTWKIATEISYGILASGLTP